MGQLHIVFCLTQLGDVFLRDVKLHYLDNAFLITDIKTRQR